MNAEFVIGACNFRRVLRSYRVRLVTVLEFYKQSVMGMIWLWPGWILKFGWTSLKRV